MKPLILLILGIGLVIFFLQNSAPIPLVFWGIIKTPTLPLALWIILFAIAGMLSSFLVQLLNYKPKEVKKDYLRDTPPYNPQPRTTPFSESRKSYQQENKANISGTDWEGEDEEDWDIEEPPKQPTTAQYPPPKPPEPREEQPPQPLKRTPSPYSYVYREREKETVKSPPKTPERQPRETSRRDQVYDANYRVITPANTEYTQPTERPLEDDEEWV